MLEGFGDTDPLRGIEHKHPLEQVNGLWIGIRVKVGKRGPDRVRKGLDVLACLWVVDEFKVRLWHGAKDVDDQFKLVEALSARKDRLSPKQLSKDASDRPDINGGIVIVAAE